MLRWINPVNPCPVKSHSVLWANVMIDSSTQLHTAHTNTRMHTCMHRSRWHIDLSSAVLCYLRLQSARWPFHVYNQFANRCFSGSDWSGTQTGDATGSRYWRTPFHYINVFSNVSCESCLRPNPPWLVWKTKSKTSLYSGHHGSLSYP